ncbi:MAG: tRNA pseudouridine(55) synthase TruB [Candidatus Aminicenantes bacterium]|nr:tRNA pseudouridine(55) synthase TruB [Candidatus Aminicenantes bacterium]MDH5383588.1 tRNA pseudouridine(55) synthase TruB [Candidatus Aminicenantes bacterium]
MDGLILVHKPKDITSHDVVSCIKKILRVEKAGHYGTLDPLATGLILVAVGKATRLFRFFLNTNKTYEGKIRLGLSTDTFDAYGQPASEESKDYPDCKTLLENMKAFEGDIDQISPPISAKKYRGKPLYELARQRKEFKLKTNRVTVHFFRLKKYNPPFVDFVSKCSSGTYIRSLAHDLGQSLGCGAHLIQLMRTEIGDFSLNDSYTLDKIEKLARQGEIRKFFLPLESLLPEFPCVVIKDAASSQVMNGSEVYPDSILKTHPSRPAESHTDKGERSIFKIFDTNGKLLAFAKKNAKKQSLHPFLVIHSRE